MKKITIALFSLILASSFMSNVANANSYFAFNLGSDTTEQVEAFLKSTSASFSSKHGTIGEKINLPIFKILKYENFDKYGYVNSAYLYFTPQNVLYKISVTYADSGRIFTTFKDGLTSKYGNGELSGFGFNKSVKYQDGKVNIMLERDTFGFGNEQKTTLTYEYTPALPEVKNMENIIQQGVIQKNAQHTATDL